jgi:CHAD domain-containing protein
MNLLHTSLSTVLQQLGMTLLDDAKTHADSVGTTDNSEALHDFRVSLRHLRSFLKSYEDYIKGAKKHRERLSEIMNLTNAGRDHEVHVAWLNARAEKASDLEKTGIDYLLENLSNKEHVELAKVKKQFDKTADKLSKTFSREVKEDKKSADTGSDNTGSDNTGSDNTGSDNADSDNKDLFAVVTANVLHKYANDFQKLLGKIDKAEDDAKIHDTRIAGKKLRYTLELLDTKEAIALVKDLKKFQDAAGDLHDLQVLEPKLQTLLFAETVLWSHAFRDGSKTLSHSELSQLPELQSIYGLAAVQRRLGAEKGSLYKDLQKNWLGAASEDFFKSLDVLIKQLDEVTREPALQEQKAKPKDTAIKKPKAKKATVKKATVKKAVPEGAALEEAVLENGVPEEAVLEKAVPEEANYLA